MDILSRFRLDNKIALVTRMPSRYWPHLRLGSGRSRRGHRRSEQILVRTPTGRGWASRNRISYSNLCLIIAPLSADSAKRAYSAR
jgi:hypothetical protein